MGAIRSEISINRPVETVYDYFANPDRDMAQAPRPTSSPWSASMPGRLGSGSTFRFRHSAGPVRESTSRFTVVRPNRELQFEGVVGALRPWNQLLFDPSQGATTVRFAGRANPTGPARVLGPLVSRMGRKLWADRLAKAKSFLEAQEVS